MVYGIGTVALITAVLITIDWKTDWLTQPQARSVARLLKEIKWCAKFTGDSEISSKLGSMTISGIFELPGAGGNPGNSETRNGKFFGWGNRTILSADFFSREPGSQIRTLLHESYHAATEDWTETYTYGYSLKKFAKIECCLRYRRVIK